MFNSKFYELKDAFTMGSLLRPVLVNIIMGKLEEKLIKKFVEDGTTILYGHFVDDTMVDIMLKDVVHVHQYLNNIDKNLRGAIFNTLFYTSSLDLEVKPRNTGQYVNDSGKIKWVFQVSWIISFSTDFRNTCSPIFLKDELNSYTDAHREIFSNICN